MYFWHNDRYWPLPQASIKPVLTGTIISNVILEFPGKEPFSVNGDEAQKVLSYALRNNVSGLVASADLKNTQFATPPTPQVTHQNGKKKREFSPEALAKMSKRREEYWADPERGGKRRKKKVTQEVHS